MAPAQLSIIDLEPGIHMSELSQVKSALDDIKKIDGVHEASLVSRGGMYVMGASAKGVQRETFAAMSAILVGAAETTSAEIKDKIDKVVVELTGQNLILVGVGPKYLVAVTADKGADADRVAAQARETISDVEAP